MGYGSISHVSTQTKKNNKFGRKISKPKRIDNLHSKDKHVANRFNKRGTKKYHAQAYSP